VQNNGQSCIAAKRFIVHTDIYDAFVDKFVEKMKALKVGDPMAEDTDLGPMSGPQGLEELDKQVQDSVAAGAKLLTGGKPMGGKGNFYPPSVLADIPKSAPAYYEELFGPVALFFRAKDIDEAIAIANDSSFGLGGSGWTQDAGEAERLVNEVETGMMYINKVTASTPEVPFGGAKNSGYGRELASFGTQSFVNAKTVWVQ
jgi:succinate-semialdehyde dehydrogenase/glutarate-semialdehyde dehydrogenase